MKVGQRWGDRGGEEGGVRQRCGSPGAHRRHGAAHQPGLNLRQLGLLLGPQRAILRALALLLLLLQLQGAPCAHAATALLHQAGLLLGLLGLLHVTALLRQGLQQGRGNRRASISVPWGRRDVGCTWRMRIPA